MTRRSPFSPVDADRAGWWWRTGGGAAFVAAVAFGLLGWPVPAGVALIVWGMCQRQSGYQYGWRDGYHTHRTMPRRQPAETGGR